MPTILPFEDAGSVVFTEEITSYWPALGSLLVKGSEDVQPVALGALGLSGEGLDAALGSSEVTGVLLGIGGGAIDEGTRPYGEGFGSLDAGDAPKAESYGSLELAGIDMEPGLGSLGVRPEGEKAPALGTLRVNDAIIPGVSLASYAARSRPTAVSRLGLAVRGEKNDIAGGTLETGGESALPAHASLVVGNEMSGEALGSADVQTGESVEFIIDITDEILASGHGDC